MGLWRFQWRFQRQYLCHGLLCANLFCFTFLIQPSAVFGQAEFSDTHSGIDEDDDDLGLSVNEAETLDADMQRMFNRFKDGRKQTSQGGNGRWSQGLEFHDSDFDGRTDHPGSYAGLESRVEETVVGQKGLSGQAWVDAHEEQKGSIGNCADGQGPDNSKCHNISSVIEDMGDAHGRSNQIGGGSDHRVYKVRDDVAQKVEEAGHEYANAVFRDAKPVNAEEAVGRFSDSGDGAQTSFSNGQLVTRFRDGRVVRSDFKENIDLLRSEAMWSVKQIEGNLWAGYQTMKAKRLAGVSGLGVQEFGNIISRGGNDAETQQQVLGEVGRRIAERQVLGDKVKFCPGGGIKTGSEQCDSSGGPSALERRLSRARSGDEISVDELRNELRSKYPNLSDQGISNLFQEITQSRQSQIKDGKIDASAARSIVNNMKSGVQLRAYANSVSGNQAKALYDAARQAASGVDSIQEELAEMVPKAQQCMQSDQWCVGAAGSYSLPPEFTRGKTSDELPKTFDIAPVRGQGGDLDPGYFFKDTRELVYRQTYRAQQGPYQNYANTIGSTADYDDNSAPEQMAAIRQRHQENMASIQRQRAEMQRIQQQGESLGNNMYRLNGVIYGLKDNAAAEYDPRRLNYKQIVGRNTRRDATFIKGTGAAAPSLPAAGSGGRARPTNRGTGRRTIGAPRGVDALRLPSSNGLN